MISSKPLTALIATATVEHPVHRLSLWKSSCFS